MKLRIETLTLAGLMVGLLGTACGPVNQKTASTFGGSTGKSQCAASLDPTATKTLDFSEKQGFVIMAEPGTPNGKPTLSTPPNNIPTPYTFFINQAANMAKLSASATVSIQYARSTGSANPRVTTVAATLQPDGSYSAPILFKHQGVYQVQMTIVDKGLTDEHSFSVTL